MKDNQLEVGDQIALRHYGKWDEDLLTVERTTKTQAICRGGFEGRLEMRFEIQLSDSGRAWLRGTESLSGKSYYYANESIQAQINLLKRQQTLYAKLNKINLSTLDLERVEALETAIQPFLTA